MSDSMTDPKKSRYASPSPDRQREVLAVKKRTLELTRQMREVLDELEATLHVELDEDEEEETDGSGV